jgi:small GTP-binding protein
MISALLEDLRKRYKKILVAGDGGVGRTALLYRYAEHLHFIEDTKMTVGVQFFSKTINVGDNEYEFIFWDLAGQEHWDSIRRDFCKGADAAILAFDLTRRYTFNNCLEWLEVLRTWDQNLPIILVGLKLDLLEAYNSLDISAEELELMLEILDAKDYVKASCKTGENVEKIFFTVYSRVLHLPEEKIIDELGGMSPLENDFKEKHHLKPIVRSTQDVDLREISEIKQTNGHNNTHDIDRVELKRIDYTDKVLDAINNWKRFPNLSEEKYNEHKNLILSKINGKTTPYAIGIDRINIDTDSEGNKEEEFILSLEFGDDYLNIIEDVLFTEEASNLAHNYNLDYPYLCEILGERPLHLKELFYKAKKEQLTNSEKQLDKIFLQIERDLIQKNKFLLAKEELGEIIHYANEKNLDAVLDQARELMRLCNAKERESSLKSDKSIDSKRLVPPSPKIPEENQLENLIRVAQLARARGEKYYKKKKYQLAIQEWSEAQQQFETALKTEKLKKKQKELLQQNIRINIEDIANCYLEKGNEHLKTAQKYLMRNNLIKAKQEFENSRLEFANSKSMAQSQKLESIDLEMIDINIGNIEIALNKIEIKDRIDQNKSIINQARQIEDVNLTKAIKLIAEAYMDLSHLKMKYQEDESMSQLLKQIDKKIINARKLQETYQEKFDDLLGIKRVTKPFSFSSTQLGPVSPDNPLEIKRGYDFVSGDVRFKVSIKNLMESTITNIKITLDFPPSLKWVLHEPRFERKGETIEILKLSPQEKIALSIYFAPISCLEGKINATITYFDAYNNPHAYTMEPKLITITCPMFFTSNTANLARVQNLYRNFTAKHRKSYPIIENSRVNLLFQAFIDVLSEFDIKMISKEFDLEEREGEAWFYGETKFNKNRIVAKLSVVPDSNVLLLEIGGNSQEQVTSFLAEIHFRIKEKIEKSGWFPNLPSYNDLKTSILLYTCPFCGDEILAKTVSRYLEGGSFYCRYCNNEISTSELKPPEEL